MAKWIGQNLYIAKRFLGVLYFFDEFGIKYLRE
jgi:hypothetical protein